MAYQSPPENCRFDHYGYDCTPMKEAYKGTWRGHQYDHESSLAPRYTHTSGLRQNRITGDHSSPPSDVSTQSYEYGVNIHKRQRISLSETIRQKTEEDSVSSMENYLDQNEQAKRNIGLLLHAARVASGMATLLFQV